MKNLTKHDSKQTILNHLNSITEIEQFSILKYYGEKIEKKQEYLYTISTIRDEQLTNLEQKINRIKSNQNKEIESINYKLNNLEITVDESKAQKVLVENGTFKNYGFKIEKNNKKIQSKKTKWNNLILKISKKQKKHIAKLESKKNKELESLDKKVSKISTDLESKDKIIQEINEKVFMTSNNKIQNLKAYKDIEQINTKYSPKIVGPLKHEELKRQFNNEVDKKINFYNKNTTNGFVKRYNLKLNMNFMFDFNNRKKLTRKSFDTIMGFKLIFIIMMFSIIVGAIEPGFFTAFNWKNIFTQNADIGCMAIGVTIIILTGGIDLSIGSVMAFGTALVANLILSGVNVVLALIAVIVFCAISGLIAGLFVSIFKFPPFIITLVLMLIWRGTAQYILENQAQGFLNDGLTKFVQTEFIGLPVTVWITLFLGVVVIIILRLTKYGRMLYAVGGNYKSAQLSGIKVKTIITSAYIFAGFCVGIGTVIYASRSQSASPSAGNAWELDAIACVVLGGTLLTGGKGGVFLTLLGWFTMSVLKNALVLVGLTTDVQSIVKGLIILVAVLSNTKYNISYKLKEWIIRKYNTIKVL